MLFAYWLIFGALFGAVTGWLAIDRNRSGLPWWLFGAVLGPIALGVLLSKPKRPRDHIASL